jgi:hypothetical protein
LLNDNDLEGRRQIGRRADIWTTLGFARVIGAAPGFGGRRRPPRQLGAIAYRRALPKFATTALPH